MTQWLTLMAEPSMSSRNAQASSPPGHDRGQPGSEPQREHPDAEQQRRRRGAVEARQQQFVEGQPGMLAGRGGPETRAT